jgi:hypothetical protein
VIHEIVAPRSIERRRQPALGDGQSDTIPDALAERPGGDFHTRQTIPFRMTWGSALPLPKLLQVVHRDVISGQVQQAVEQHASMTR